MDIWTSLWVVVSTLALIFLIAVGYQDVKHGRTRFDRILGWFMIVVATFSIFASKWYAELYFAGTNV